MKQTRSIIAVAIALCVATATAVSVVAFAGSNDNEPTMRLILDTDFEEDVDDVGALAVAHALQAGGEVELLGVMVSTPGWWGAAAVDAVNTFYGYPNIPIGVTEPVWPSTRSLYNKQLAEQFPKSIRTAYDAPEAVTLYRRLLAEQPDNSVTIASIGLLTNLAALLRSPADETSNLTGEQLVQAKVERLLVMGGAYPSGEEYNFAEDPRSAASVAEMWPTPVVYCGFEVGEPVLTGSELFLEAVKENPVREAYRLYVGEGGVRSSWDQTTVLYAVRGGSNLFVERGMNGSNEVDRNSGANTWRFDSGRGHSFLVKTAPDEEIAAEIDALMAWKPNMPASTSAGPPHWLEEFASSPATEISQAARLPQ